MFRTRSPRLFRAALAACLAVVTTMPPAMGHAHAGGDRPHQHAHDHGGHDHHGHRHSAAEVEQPTIAPLGATGMGRFAHVHFAWLGLEVTFAWPVGSSTEGDGQPEHIVVRLLDSAAQNSGPVDVPSPLATLSAMDVVQDAGRLASPPLAAVLQSLIVEAPPASLLCDAARHERSGVLLS